MKKVIVIGAGASGIIAALKASENNEVILIDQNDNCGKKLTMTGNGRCNFWHENIDEKSYYSDDIEALKSILKRKDEVYDYLLKLGIYPKIKDGYYYPQCNSALSFRETLDNELKKHNIIIKYNTNVKDILNTEKGFKVVCEGEVLYCDKIILSTGSKAVPKTGSDGFAYTFAKNNNIVINPVLPSLTSLVTDEPFLKNWSGIRCDASVSLYVEDIFIKKETGEIQLTDNGISGICTFNISGNASRALNNNKSVCVRIDFAPFTTDFEKFFTKRALVLNDLNIKQLCESLFPYKLTDIILKRCNITANAFFKSLTAKEKECFFETVTSFNLDILGTGSFEKAQVCTGGISLKEINPSSMESLKIKDMFFTGEELDVDGICGGYNLAFAFVSGYIAGESV